MIVPAYDEEARLEPTLRRIHEYLSAQDYTWSVTVVSDGSKDGTVAISEGLKAEDARFGVMHYTPNRGKGYAVRKGMVEIPGEYILFTDADLAAPIEEVEKLWQAISENVPIAIGSRPLKESRLEIRQPWHREMLGRAFNFAVQTLAVRGIKDTQCGFKLFRKDVAVDVFSRCKLNGFGFDFESLMIARDLNIAIAEVPIRWAHQEGSKVVLMRDGPRMLRELVKLRLLGKSGRLKVREAKD